MLAISSYFACYIHLVIYTAISINTHIATIPKMHCAFRRKEKKKKGKKTSQSNKYISLNEKENEKKNRWKNMENKILLGLFKNIFTGNY